MFALLKKIAFVWTRDSEEKNEEEERQDVLVGGRVIAMTKSQALRYSELNRESAPIQRSNLQLNNSQQHSVSVAALRSSPVENSPGDQPKCVFADRSVTPACGIAESYDQTRR